MTTAMSADSGKLTISSRPLSPEELRKMNDYWRAANYLSVGQIYLYANPLLREPLKLEHVKPRLLGHWGTTPGLNLQSGDQEIRSEYDLYLRAGARRSGYGGEYLPGGHLHGGLLTHSAK